ncbi:hypothetical protein D3C71_1159890 [compost metagenome]
MSKAVLDPRIVYMYLTSAVWDTSYSLRDKPTPKLSNLVSETSINLSTFQQHELIRVCFEAASACSLRYLLDVGVITLFAAKNDENVSNLMYFVKSCDKKYEMLNDKTNWTQKLVALHDTEDVLLERIKKKKTVGMSNN